MLQALLTTGIWFSIPRFFHWSENSAVFWYLAYCTFISFATQFTLAYQNKKAELHMLNTMRLLVALAEEAKTEQVDIGGQLDQIVHRIKDDRSNSIGHDPVRTPILFPPETPGTPPEEE